MELLAGKEANYSISRPIEGASLCAISLGAGVQSSVLALLAARGEISPMPDAAIFADTQWEPNSVYEHLNWLESQLPFPVYRVTAGDIRANALANKTAGGSEFQSIPWYIQGHMGRRQCTREYKIVPIQNEVRRLLGYPAGKKIMKDVAELWIGISTDEIVRMKDSGKRWIAHRWPLIEMRWSRSMCISWFSDNYPGRVLPKSSCIGCPYRPNQSWIDMANNNPDEFADAVEVDEAIRNIGSVPQFMHRSFVPLKDIDTSGESPQMDFGFLEECEGMCGI